MLMFYEKYFLCLCKGTSASGAVNRLTDTSQYTGSHKERFDSSGKGKGKRFKLSFINRKYLAQKNGKMFAKLL